MPRAAAPMSPVAVPATVAPVTAAMARETAKEAMARAGEGLPEPQRRFYKVLSSGMVFYKDDDRVLHPIPGTCDTLSCPDEPLVVGACNAAVPISEELVAAQVTGKDFSCHDLDDSGTSWWVVLLWALLLLCFCAACNYGLWYFYVPIVKRCPGLDGLLPFQWFGARNSFTKLQRQARQEDRTFRSVGQLYERGERPEDQLPLMSGGQFAGAMPPLPPEAMVEGGSAGYGSGPAGNYTGSGTGPHSYRGPLPPTEAGYDLVTVTPTGLQVTPLGNVPLPPGVPIVNPPHAVY